MSSFEMLAPENARFRLTIDYTLKQWKEIATALDGIDPAYAMVRDIRNMVAQAERTFYPSAQP